MFFGIGWRENKTELHTIKHNMYQGLNLNCIVIHELFVTTELPNDELTSIRT